MSALIQEVKIRCPKIGSTKKFKGVEFAVIRTQMAGWGNETRWLVTYGGGSDA